MQHRVTEVRVFGEGKIGLARERGSSPTVREGVFTWIILTPLLTRGLLPRPIQIANLQSHPREMPIDKLRGSR
jgi:hypothetical protein